MPRCIITSLPYLNPFLKDLHYSFHSFHYLYTDFDSSQDYNILLPTRVNMILWAPETKEYPYKPVHLQIWFLTNQLSVRTWRQFEEESDRSWLPGIRLNFTCEINQTFFLLFSIWLSGRFLFITWSPPPAHPVTQK